jgi:Protein of unknown function (DUF3775)
MPAVTRYRRVRSYLKPTVVTRTAQQVLIKSTCELPTISEQLMLKAITPVQVGELIALLEQLTAARKARVAQGRTQTVDEIINEPERRRLTDYLYGLSDDARKELIALMLLGRGDFEYSYQRALETCAKYSDPDDQVIYLMGKTVRLAEYLNTGLNAIAGEGHTQEPGSAPGSSRTEG